MADYFTHFSCLLDVGTPDNAARALDLYNRMMEENAAEDPSSEAFLLSIQPEHGRTQLWIRDDVTGDPQAVIDFVLRCAKEFGLTGAGVFNGPTLARALAPTPSEAARTCSTSVAARPLRGSRPIPGSTPRSRPGAASEVRHEHPRSRARQL